MESIFYCYGTPIPKAIFYYYGTHIQEIIFYFYETPILEDKNYFFIVMEHLLWKLFLLLWNTYFESCFFTVMEHLFQKREELEPQSCKEDVGGKRWHVTRRNRCGGNGVVTRATVPD